MEVNSNIFIETNSYSYFTMGDARIQKIIFKSSKVLISVITLGELFLGFKEGSREEKNLLLLDEFLSDPKVKILNITKDTAKIYGGIKYNLRRKGTPVPENDIWIAAHAIEANSTLITYDKHFLEIPGVKLWKELH